MPDGTGVTLDQGWLTTHGAALAANLVGPWARTQRWFGDKSRVVAGFSLPFAIPIAESGDRFLLAVVEFAFESGPPARYFVPLSALRESGSGQMLGVCGGVPFADAVTDESFLRWLGRESAVQASVVTDAGATAWHGVGTDDIAELVQPDVTVRPLNVEQSNSSVLYGDRILVKLLRRLQSGANPEIEISRFLTTRTGFRNTPRLHGWWSVDFQGEEIALAVAQSFESSEGDGWRYALDALTMGSDAFPLAAARLGERTAELHLALASDDESPDFAQEPVGSADIDLWSNELRSNIGKAVESIRASIPSSDGRTQDLRNAFLAAADRLARQTSGFECLAGCAKIRVHGDFHLGQTLRTAQGDWIILDFEGEPSRSLAQRCAKTSPLKDVAGMLRSFGYARGFVGRQIADDQSSSSAATLLGRERAARDAFLHAYIATARSGKQHFLPNNNEDLGQAIAAWEIDKAVYEIRYELDNRPDWLWLPLSAVMKYA